MGDDNLFTLIVGASKEYMYPLLLWEGDDFRVVANQWSGELNAFAYVIVERNTGNDAMNNPTWVKVAKYNIDVGGFWTLIDSPFERLADDLIRSLIGIMIQREFTK